MRRPRRCIRATPDLLIFHCDGVLIGSELITCRVVAECLTEHGFAVETAMCVASSSSAERIRHSLGWVGLLDRFEGALFSAATATHGKPAPDLFLHAAATCRVAPTGCVVIEDSVPGIVAARAAGMRAGGFTGGAHCRLGHASTLRRAGADDVARSMAALGPLLATP